jgi:phospholipase/lecithinase/hemolysin
MANQITLNLDLPEVSVSLTPDRPPINLDKLSGTYTVQLPDSAPARDVIDNFIHDLTHSGSFSWDTPFGKIHADYTFQRNHFPPINHLVVFGDSLSDTGNLFNLTGQKIPPSPPYFDGRSSNGPLWIDYLGPRLGVPNDSISNFAVVGAKTGRENVSTDLFGLPKELKLPGLLDEIDTYAAQTAAQTHAAKSHRADPRGLYVVFAGSNDLLNLPPDPQAAAAGITQAITNISTAIAKLADLGAERIVVPNSVNLGLAPFPNRAGYAAQATQASVIFNQALHQTLTQLEHNLGVDLIEVDLFSLSQRIATNPGEFGFTNVKDPLIEQTNPVNPAGYAWWDQIHPTTQVHRLIADAIESAIPRSVPGSHGRPNHLSLTDSVLGNAGLGSHQPLVASSQLTRLTDSPLMKV